MKGSTIYLRCCLVVGLSIGFCFAQAQDISKSLKTYFSEIRSGKHPSPPRQLAKTDQDRGAALRALEPYLKDTAALIRRRAYALVQQAGYAAKEEKVRQDATTKLVQAIKDRDGGAAGAALEYLKGFRRPDFTVSSRDTVAAIFGRRPSHYDQVIRLVGFLEITSLQTPLRGLVQQGDAPKKDRWAALLALARMGDNYAIDDVLKRVRRLPVTDEVVYEIFPDLVYTRRREAMSFLVDALNSDEKNCSSADAEHNAKIPCAYRVMEMLAPAINGYPLEVDEAGDVVAKDYTVALQTVRTWFKENPQYTTATDRQ